MSLFFIHLGCLLACVLNFIDNCIEGGLGILYSLLFTFIFNPLALLLFYRGTHPFRQLTLASPLKRKTSKCT